MIFNPTVLFINVSDPTRIPDNLAAQCCPTVQWVGYFGEVLGRRGASVSTDRIPLNLEHPFPLAQAISEFLMQKHEVPGHALLITDKDKDVIDAGLCHVRVVFVGTSYTQDDLPDAWCSTMQALTTWQAHQFLGELRSGDLDSTGGLLVLGLHPSNYDAAATLWGTGRYFAKNDPRSEVHLFTKRLLSLKNWQQGPVDNALIRIMRASVAIMEHDTSHFTMMTSIPPKRGSPDRLGALLRQSFPDDKRVNPALIRIAKPIEKQSRLGRTARRDNVKDAYVPTSASLADHNILVVDDVVTSGATLSEVAIQLAQRGASVACLALGVDQHLVPDSKLQLPCLCGTCDGHMIVRLSRTTFRPFWGCTNWHQGCRETLDYVSGLNAYYQLQPHFRIMKDWDLPF